MEAGKSKTKVPMGSGLDEGPADGHLLTVSLHGRGCRRDGEDTLVSFSSYKDTNPIMGASPSRLHLNLELLKGPTSKYYRFEN